MRDIALGVAAYLFAMSAAHASETLTYVYDARGRLVTVAHSGTVNNGVSTTYSSDNADNRILLTTTGASH